MPEQPTSPVEPPAGPAILVYSDLACPWSYVFMHRLREVRRREGFDDLVIVDHRALPLELVNLRPTPKDLLDREIRACVPLAPDASWSDDPEPWSYPVSTLAGLEAVQAAKAQGPGASEELDVALRTAVFGEWRCISVHGVVLEVAAGVPDLDVDALWDEIRSGRPRAEVWHQYEIVKASDVGTSPTAVIADGSILENPGIEFRHDDTGEIVIESDAPSVIEDLVLQAAGRVAAE